MNRRKSIIISITGLTIVLLALIGLTYGYFAANLQGNTNNKSIQVTTSTLNLVYNDGDSGLITGSKISPGETIGSKDFRVVNKGDATNYLVFLDNVSITDSVTNEEVRLESNDFVYTLTCTSSDDKPCNQMPGNNKLPLENGGLIVANSIDTNVIQEYNITITYLSTDKEQNNDMGKTISARLNIKGVTNPYENNQDSLAYNIINNAMQGINGTSLKATPETIPFQQQSEETEKELSITPDDYGISYYYRGNVEDNYVEFAGMCWRIVRIQGDGSVKIILASEQTCDKETNASGYATSGTKGAVGTMLTSHYGYKKVGDYIVSDYVNSLASPTGGAKYKLNDWFDKKIGKESSDYGKLKEEKWCIGDLTNAYSYSNTGSIIGNVDDNISNNTSFIYTAGNRYRVIKTPKLRCETTGVLDETDSSVIGMLTMDEAAFAGGGQKNNATYYLNKNATTRYWWTLSPSRFADGAGQSITIRGTGDVDSGDGINYGNISLRPVVTLNPSIVISGGTGIIGDPYIIPD